MSRGGNISHGHTQTYTDIFLYRCAIWLTALSMTVILVTDIHLFTLDVFDPGAL